jgi:hypothetical protein
VSMSSFFSKLGSELKSLFTKEPAFEQLAQGVITYVSPILLTVLTFVDPAIEPLVSKVISVVQADLATVSTVVKGATVTAGSTAAATVQAALGSITSNLSGLLQVAEVKDSSKIAEITAAANTISTEINSLVTALPTV